MCIADQQQVIGNLVTVDSEHPMGGFWGVGGIGMMFFLGLVIVGAVLGIRWLITQRKE